MTKIAISEGVGADLEPNDDGVDFADSAEEGVVDIVVNSQTGN